MNGLLGGPEDVRGSRFAQRQCGSIRNKTAIKTGACLATEEVTSLLEA
jgi:hypothetical protein